MGVENKVETSDLRNVMLPLAIPRQNYYIRALFTGIISLLFVLLINNILGGELARNVYKSMIVAGLSLYIIGKIVDVIYILVQYNLMSGNEPGIVIGYSNKIIVLQGTSVLYEIETDEISIRSIRPEETTEYYKGTSILEGKNGGEQVIEIPLEALYDYEGCVLRANPLKMHQDIEIIYPNGK